MEDNPVVQHFRFMCRGLSRKKGVVRTVCSSVRIKHSFGQYYKVLVRFDLLILMRPRKINSTLARKEKYS